MDASSDFQKFLIVALQLSATLREELHNISFSFAQKSEDAPSLSEGDWQKIALLFIKTIRDLNHLNQLFPHLPGYSTEPLPTGAQITPEYEIESAKYSDDYPEKGTVLTTTVERVTVLQNDLPEPVHLQGCCTVSRGPTPLLLTFLKKIATNPNLSQSVRSLSSQMVQEWTKKEVLHDYQEDILPDNNQIKTLLSTLFQEGQNTAFSQLKSLLITPPYHYQLFPLPEESSIPWEDCKYSIYFLAQEAFDEYLSDYEWEFPFFLPHFSTKMLVKKSGLRNAQHTLLFSAELEILVINPLFALLKNLLSDLQSLRQTKQLQNYPLHEDDLLALENIHAFFQQSLDKLYGSPLQVTVRQLSQDGKTEIVQHLQDYLQKELLHLLDSGLDHYAAKSLPLASFLHTATQKIVHVFPVPNWTSPDGRYCSEAIKKDDTWRWSWDDFDRNLAPQKQLFIQEVEQRFPNRTWEGTVQKKEKEPAWEALEILFRTLPQNLPLLNNQTAPFTHSTYQSLLSASPNNTQNHSRKRNRIYAELAIKLYPLLFEDKHYNVSEPNKEFLYFLQKLKQQQFKIIPDLTVSQNWDNHIIEPKTETNSGCTIHYDYVPQESFWPKGTLIQCKSIKLDPPNDVSLGTAEYSISLGLKPLLVQVKEQLFANDNLTNSEQNDIKHHFSLSRNDQISNNPNEIIQNCLQPLECKLRKNFTVACLHRTEIPQEKIRNAIFSALISELLREFKPLSAEELLADFQQKLTLFAQKENVLLHSSIFRQPFLPLSKEHFVFISYGTLDTDGRQLVPHRIFLPLLGDGGCWYRRISWVADALDLLISPKNELALLIKHCRTIYAPLFGYLTLISNDHSRFEFHLPPVQLEELRTCHFENPPLPSSVFLLLQQLHQWLIEEENIYSFPQKEGELLLANQIPFEPSSVKSTPTNTIFRLLVKDILQKLRTNLFTPNLRNIPLRSPLLQNQPPLYFEADIIFSPPLEAPTDALERTLTTFTYEAVSFPGLYLQEETDVEILLEPLLSFPKPLLINFWEECSTLLDEIPYFLKRSDANEDKRRSFQQRMENIQKDCQISAQKHLQECKNIATVSPNNPTYQAAIDKIDEFTKYMYKTLFTNTLWLGSSWDWPPPKNTDLVVNGLRQLARFPSLHFKKEAPPTPSLSDCLAHLSIIDARHHSTDNSPNRFFLFKKQKTSDEKFSETTCYVYFPSDSSSHTIPGGFWHHENTISRYLPIFLVPDPSPSNLTLLMRNLRKFLQQSEIKSFELLKECLQQSTGATINEFLIMLLRRVIEPLIWKFWNNQNLFSTIETFRERLEEKLQLLNIRRVKYEPNVRGADGFPSSFNSNNREELQKKFPPEAFDFAMRYQKASYDDLSDDKQIGIVQQAYVMGETIATITVDAGTILVKPKN